VTDPIRELLDRLTHEIDNWECAIAGNQNAETRGYLTSRRDESFAERQAIIDLARERDTVMADAKSMARLLKREREDGNALSAALEAAHSERDVWKGRAEDQKADRHLAEKRELNALRERDEALRAFESISAEHARVLARCQELTVALARAEAEAAHYKHLHEVELVAMRALEANEHRLAARVRDLERDKERLDWLAENAMKAVTPDDFVDSLIQFAYPGNDLREAIDAARAQRREEPSE